MQTDCRYTTEGENIFMKFYYIHRTITLAGRIPHVPAIAGGASSPNSMAIRIGVVDDHQLFSTSLSYLINSFPGFETVLKAPNGKVLLESLPGLAVLPDILLLDVNMPVMDGCLTAAQVAKLYPDIRIVALSTDDEDHTIIAMLRAGCCAYLLKDITGEELEQALQEVYAKGFYNADVYNLRYRRLLLNVKEDTSPRLSEKELQFLKLACSDLTYKEIAAQMHLAERTIDGYREAIFEKFNVQSRVGMALEAIRRKLVSL